MITVNPGNLVGEVTPPPSKSASHRALILGSLSHSGSIITNLLNSEDVMATKSALKSMGTQFDEKDNIIRILSGVNRGSKLIDCKNSGTTLRLMSSIAGLFSDETILTGDASLRTRPMGDLIDALRQLGISAEDNHGKPPVKIAGGRLDKYVECDISGKKSSQFLSSLLIFAAVRGDDCQTRINVISDLVSTPYVKLTMKMLENLGCKIGYQNNSYFIEGSNKLNTSNTTIPADYSSAAYFLVAGALPGNKIAVHGLSDELPQADSKILDFLVEMGAGIVKNHNKITTNHRELFAFDANLKDCPDLFPILAVFAALADGTSVLSGAEHLKFKETDRILTTCEMLRRFGISVKSTSDGAIIKGSEAIGGVEIDSFGDHRIAMAASILSTQSNKPVVILNPECVNVSYSNFYQDLDRIRR